MATLQNLRNRGPLLIIIVGLALFAFIVGDLWKIFDSSQQDVTIGTINEEEVSALDYQQELNKQTLASSQKYTGDFPVNNSEYIANEVWNKFILDSELKETAEDMGFGATENTLINAINSYTNIFNGDVKYYSSFYHTMWWISQRQNHQFFESFILALAQEDKANTEDAESMIKAWEVTKENLKDEILYRNVSNFINNSLTTNPQTAKLEYDFMNTSYDIDVIEYPFEANNTAVTDADYQAYYNKNKSYYKNYYNSRDIKILDYTVTPSTQDIQFAMSDAREQINKLKEEFAKDTTGLAQMIGTWDTSSLPLDVQSQIENAEVSSFLAPKYNGANNTVTIYQLVEKAEIPEEIKFSFMLLTPEMAQNSDSIINLLNNGTSFKEFAEANKLQPNTYAIDTTCTFTQNIQSRIYPESFFKAELNKVIAEDANAGAKVIYQVTSATNPSTRHKVFVAPSTVTPSSQTMEEASLKFNTDVKNAKNNFSKLEKENQFGMQAKLCNDYNAASTSANFMGRRYSINELTKRWILDVAKPGEISEVLSEGNTLYVVSVAAVHNKGEMTLDELKSTTAPIYYNITTFKDKVANEKYAAMVVKDKVGNKTFDQLSSDSTLKVQHYSSFNLMTSNELEQKVAASLYTMKEGETRTIIGDEGVYVLHLNKKGKVTANEEENAKSIKNYTRNGFAALGRFTEEINAINELAQERYNENFVTFYNSTILKSIVENSETEDQRYKHF